MDVKWAGPIAAAIIAFHPEYTYNAVSGMETSLSVVLIGACFWAYLYKRQRLAGGLAALAIMTRPDSVLLPIVITVHSLLQRKVPWQFYYGLLLILPWMIFAWVYFGSPLPNSMFAKMHRDSQLIANLVFWVRFLAYEGLFRCVWFPFFLLGLGVLVRTPVWFIPLWLTLYVAGFTLSGVHIGHFRWYGLAIVPVYGLIGGVGLLRIAGIIACIRDRVNVLVPSGVGILIALLLWQTSRAYHTITERITSHEGAYRQAIQFLNITDHDLVAANEIGTIGFYSRCRILDLAGLVSPEVKSTPDPIQTFRPDFIIGFPVHIPQHVPADYDSVKDVPGGVVILQRRNVE